MDRYLSRAKCLDSNGLVVGYLHAENHNGSWLIEFISGSDSIEISQPAVAITKDNSLTGITKIGDIYNNPELLEES